MPTSAGLTWLCVFTACLKSGGRGGLRVRRDFLPDTLHLVRRASPGAAIQLIVNSSGYRKPHSKGPQEKDPSKAGLLRCQRVSGDGSSHRPAALPEAVPKAGTPHPQPSLSIPSQVKNQIKACPNEQPPLLCRSPRVYGRCLTFAGRFLTFAAHPYHPSRCIKYLYVLY